MSGRLRGTLRVPGDKSISHRALILGAMARDETRIEGLSSADDVRSTWRCLVDCGVRIVSNGTSTFVSGLGWRGLKMPKRALDAENSGTTTRLLMGVLAGHDMYASITGDDSLRRRPMGRVAEPLRRMGATIELAKGDRAPVKVRGAALKGIDYATPVASAQIKSAVLLAGLLATESTSVTEPSLSRDHTERLLPVFGAQVVREGLKTTVRGALPLAAARVVVPGDASSAAFFAVGAAIAPGSEVRVKDVGLNPTRAAFADVLRRMGARVETAPSQEATGEPLGELVVSHAPLRAADIAPAEVPALLDEIPVLAVAAARAEGVSRFRGLSELRVKESDRLAAVAAMLTALGGSARVEGDDLVIEGGRPLRGGAVVTHSDHRIAMAARVASLVCDGPVKLDDEKCVGVSYPEFPKDWGRLLG